MDPARERWHEVLPISHGEHVHERGTLPLLMQRASQRAAHHDAVTQAAAPCEHGVKFAPIVQEGGGNEDDVASAQTRLRRASAPQQGIH